MFSNHFLFYWVNQQYSGVHTEAYVEMYFRRLLCVQEWGLNKDIFQKSRYVHKKASVEMYFSSLVFVNCEAYLEMYFKVWFVYKIKLCRNVFVLMLLLWTLAWRCTNTLWQVTESFPTSPHPYSNLNRNPCNRQWEVTQQLQGHCSSFIFVTTSLLTWVLLSLMEK